MCKSKFQKFKENMLSSRARGFSERIEISPEGGEN
jgi:hypothetical protein